MSHPKYLKPWVQIEPLIDRWYAWPHLVSPVTAALNIVRRHVPIMESYVSDPTVHAESVADPDLLGGPFIDYGGERVDDIARLIDATRSECAVFFDVVKAVVSLNEMLRTHGNGSSLEKLYPLVPAPLKGLVELVYDTNHKPSVRYLEPLLYKSDLYMESLQSIALLDTNSDERKFVLSTPRLDDANTICLPVPFRSPLIDRLFEMRTRPRPIEDIAELFAGAGEIDEITDRFFTNIPPRRVERFSGPGVQLRYFGHACLLIESAQVSILADPVVSYEYPNDLERFTYLDLPERIDYVLLTHNHQDHVMLETLLQIRHRVGCVVVPNASTGSLQDPSLAIMLRAIGFSNVHPVDMLEEVAVPGGKILPIPFLGEHSDLRIDTKSGYAVTLEGRTIVLASDSRNLEPEIYRRIAPIIGSVDALYIGMECDGAPLTWLYGPLLTMPIDRGHDGSRALSGSDYAMVESVLHLLKPKSVFVYAMGQEPWLNHVMCLRYNEHSLPIVESNKIMVRCRELGIPFERPFSTGKWLLEDALDSLNNFSHLLTRKVA